MPHFLFYLQSLTMKLPVWIIMSPEALNNYAVNRSKSCIPLQIFLPTLPTIAGIFHKPKLASRFDMEIGLIYPNKGKKEKAFHVGLASIASYASTQHDNLNFTFLDTRISTPHT